MKTSILDLTNNKNVEIKDISISNKGLMAIDASTKNTGVCIIDIDTERPLYSITVSRESKETAIEYKVSFKRFIASLLLENISVYKNVRVIVQEEPFISAMKTATEVLMSLRTSIPELLVEHKHLLEGFEYHEINNKVWKKKLFKPDKCPSNSSAEKEMAKKKVTELCPIYKSLSQDEIDACGMGIICCRELNSGNEIKDKQRVSRFAYEIKFTGGESLSDALNEVHELVIPEEVISNGCEVAGVPSNGNLEKRIFELMGEEDKLLIFEFSPKKAGNIVFKYKLTSLANECEMIYAFVWRKNRKK